MKNEFSSKMLFNFFLEKNEHLFKEFLNNTRKPNETRIINNFVREKDSSTESDSDSDFDDFNTDVKELNDYKWD